MVSQKRGLEEPSSSRESKKPKKDARPPTDMPVQPSLLSAEEVDFPRGGGTSLTALEVKATRAEGVKEANAELFDEKESKGKGGKKKKRKADESATTEKKSDKIRIEHLNYKRLTPGLKIMGQIVGILPLALLSDNEDDEEKDASSLLPELGQIFKVGQYIRTVISASNAPGTSDPSGLSRSRDELARSCRRVELSLLPNRVNERCPEGGLKGGILKSVEDHGYVLDLGISGVDGFLSFKEFKSKKPEASSRLSVGQIIETTVVSLSSNQRTCTVTVDPLTFRTSSNSEVASVKSVLPGSLVQALVTEVSTEGVTLQLMGFFDGTVDRIHLRHEGKALKVGQKVKARVLYQHSADPPRFALALSQHLIDMDSRKVPVQERYPLGAVLESAKVIKIESERGLYLEVEKGLEGFAHISQVSDDHLPTLTTSGPWKVNTLHRGRIALKPSVFEQEFLQLTDFQVGEPVKATIKTVSEHCLSSSNCLATLTAVVWPNHFADIKLKHPGRRFKPESTLKCKVLVVDLERKRIALTAKKTLVESDLPYAKPGLITNGVVFKVFEKHLLVEFYNNLKAYVPLKEASDTPNAKLADSFPVGRVVRVKVVSSDAEQGRIVASIKQAVARAPVPDVSAVEIGDTVKVLTSSFRWNLPRFRALVSIKNLANNRKLSPAQMHATIRVGDLVDDLLVVTRNPEKGIVIVAKKPSVRPYPSRERHPGYDGYSYCRPTQHWRFRQPYRHIRQLRDWLAVFACRQHHPGCCNLHQQGQEAGQHNVADREIESAADLHVGDTVRGYVKNIAEHGLFVTVGRGVDARVQIRELFDEFVKEWKPKFKENQLVKGRVLSVDAEANKIEMTFKTGDLSRETKSSAAQLKEGQKVAGHIKRVEDYGLFIDIEGTKLHGLCHKSQLTDNAEANVSEALQGFRVGDKVKAMVTGEADVSMDAVEDDDAEEEDEEIDTATSSKPIPSLTLSEGFQWFGESHNSDEEDNASFRRELLLGSPNSSYLWIQYMSFQLQISEIDKAREIGRRAEGERLNVWIALLNLENDAARANDSKTIHLRMAAIFDQSGKPELKSSTRSTGKKFGKSSKVWAQFGEFYLKQGKLEEARKLLPRSLQSLEKRKHLKTISRFAQMEYKLGDPERGRTLFEGIVDSHPKRWDLWSVYIDMEAGQKDIQFIRNLMARVLALKMTSHKAKAFFKKWLDLEKRIGDEEGVDTVKQKAVEWTQRATAAATGP
ncbi:hypothetical protein DFP72DRAFT_867062 [Ephemerocybe angulata]|uniref:S1 motif domain-containing protein n=1 Tax=Ephemerocybe angulata TaxID=980116 RepID=A0A8H6IJB2_9AGAR|nr:hypothetical protein DFP72DRAFT_867062 [Tulosesus angulatus]